MSEGSAVLSDWASSTRCGMYLWAMTYRAETLIYFRKRCGAVMSVRSLTTWGFIFYASETQVGACVRVCVESMGKKSIP